MQGGALDKQRWAKGGRHRSRHKGGQFLSARLKQPRLERQEGGGDACFEGQKIKLTDAWIDHLEG